MAETDSLKETPKTDAQAKFLTGSTMRHVSVMAASAAIGLMAIFLVDLVDFLFLSMLGIVEIQSAVGIAGTILFANISLSVGLMIGAVALISRAVGSGDQKRAKQTASVTAFFVVFVLTIIGILTSVYAETLLIWLGATGKTLELAYDYMIIIVPSLPLLGITMITSGTLRAVGDAKRAATATILAGLVNAVLDPILIFGLDMGIEGAATASVAARVAGAVYGIYCVTKVYDMWEMPELPAMKTIVPGYLAISVPAILTQIATPFSNGYIQIALTDFGDPAVASWSFLSRLVPVAFGTLFALSGAVGPIIGQNYGAGQIDRVKSAFRDGLIFAVVYTFVVSLIILLISDWLMDQFNLIGEAREIAAVFIYYGCPLFLFNGLLFVANASFNTLGFAMNATLFNWGRATLGTIPFAIYGASLYGAEGIVIGHALGAIPFGILSIITAWYVMSHRLKPDNQSI